MFEGQSGREGQGQCFLKKIPDFYMITIQLKFEAKNAGSKVVAFTQKV